MYDNADSLECFSAVLIMHFDTIVRLCFQSFVAADVAINSHDVMYGKPVDSIYVFAQRDSYVEE